MRFLVTAGPTREFLDPVRFLSNPSSGKMGYAIAESAQAHGHDVLIVSGPVYLPTPPGVKKIDVTTALEMRDQVLLNKDTADVIIMVAAVADYRPEERHSHKIKKEQDSMTVHFLKNPDILYELGQEKKYLLAGFAAETRQHIDNAKKKLIEKNLDFIVVNRVDNDEAGFQSDTNIISIIDKDGQITEYPKMLKRDIAEKIVQYVEEIAASS